MSTTMHSPSPTHSPTDFLACRSRRPDVADSSFTPFRQTTSTPRKSFVAARHGSPVLLLTTPSPLRRRLDRDENDDCNMDLDFDDFSGATGFSTPYRPRRSSRTLENDQFKVPEPPHSYHRSYKPPIDDDDEGMFLRSDIGHKSLPLRTPERHPFDISLLGNTVANPNFSCAPKRKVSVINVIYYVLF